MHILYICLVKRIPLILHYDLFLKVCFLLAEQVQYGLCFPQHGVSFTHHPLL
ncbi:unnamed protein product [Lupinus luteus]|uniref:Uncharacterized protein n=1 Tax=Lupinus luteus TaxID=3873 RepID=A0AAV1Y2X2_LUPLU